jgi:FkbM family methyltransferase
MSGLFESGGIIFEFLNEAEAVQFYYEIFHFGVYWRHSFLDALVAPSTEPIVVADIGANIGLFSLRCLRDYRHSIVHAFEPANAVYDVLKRNLLNNCDDDLERVNVYHCALRDRSGDNDEFYYFPDMPGESTFQLQEQVAQQTIMADRTSSPLVSTKIACKSTTLSEWIDSNAIDNIDILKIDVEGDELKVLRGIRADHWLRIRLIVAEVHDIDGRLADVVKLLQTSFDVVEIDAETTETYYDEDGEEEYRITVDPKLKLFYVYSFRQSLTTQITAKQSSPSTSNSHQ